VVVVIFLIFGILSYSEHLYLRKYGGAEV
jgi:hypothetical protein